MNKPILLALLGLLLTVAQHAQGQQVTPLYTARTQLEPATRIRTTEALITRVSDRVRDRHAREKGAYDHYLSWYWQERTVVIELIDRVAMGGKDITINVTALAALNRPDFRCFFRGINTVAEYHHNAATKSIGANQYSTTVTYNNLERRALKIGDRMEFEFSPFLLAPSNGRKNYYGTTMLYVVGQGIVPWYGQGEKLDSIPLPKQALLGGLGTLPYQYSNEPRHRFMQMATNIAPVSGQAFMLGRRLHHTNFKNGSHSEQPNPGYPEQAGKVGPGYVARSCIACHVNNGRALPPKINKPMRQSVVKVGADMIGTPHPTLGSSLQSAATDGDPETVIQIQDDISVPGMYADGTPYVLRKPRYAFTGITPRHYSVRLSPQLVGLGLLEAIAEKTVIANADPSDDNQDGISGRIQVVTDPETGERRLGRFGYKAGQASIRLQVASALNHDMGVTTTVFPMLDGETTSGKPELANKELAQLTRYIATLGVSARRNLQDEEALSGEKLFMKTGCAKCHITRFTTSPYHPFAELRNQTIHPYTDLLLHDMGPGLADNLAEQGASGAEWRTAPLWGIGLTAGVSGAEAYLHDGRARTLPEAILWHGGEGKSAREAFRNLSATERAALLTFLESL
ncbi:MAG: c-type cytochrome [Planctomycetaceae bacterium]|nr:c-type cytochrome [Planctomycetaceae bacterium]